MPIAPELLPMVEAAKSFPAAASMPVADLRAALASYAAATPKLDTPLASVENRAIPGPAGPLNVRLYTPLGAGPFPVLVFFHGGGFIMGNLDSQDNGCRALCALAGAMVMSVDYRLAPEHPFPAPVDDAYAALLWAGAHARDIGGDPARLAVCGESAGGVLAMAAALRVRDEGGPKLAAQMNFYGACNFPSALSPSAIAFADGPIISTADVAYFWRLYLADEARDQHHPYASPFRARSHDRLPPAFIGTAEIDPSRDDAESYADKLSSAGVPVVLRRAPGMIHGYLSWVAWSPTAKAHVEEAGAWLKAQFAAVK